MKTSILLIISGESGENLNPSISSKLQSPSALQIPYQSPLRQGGDVELSQQPSPSSHSRGGDIEYPDDFDEDSTDSEEGL